MSDFDLDPDADVDAENPAEAVDPVDLEPGDRVRVESDLTVVVGTVEKVTVEAGRAGVTIVDDDGQSYTCWEEIGRTWTRFPDVDDDRTGADSDA